MSDARQRQLPADVAHDVPQEAERAALERVWNALESARPSSGVSPADSSAMWAAIMAGTSTPSAEPAPKPSATRSPSRHAAAVRAYRPAWSRRRARYGAIAALALTVVVGVLGRPGAWQDVQVARGAQRVVQLPDGSEVSLAAGSRLRYREGFRGWFGRMSDREAQLEGAAFFDIATDGRAFIVRTYNADVRVLGTQFEVQAWPSDSAGTAVAVAEGRVALAGRAGGDVTLEAGDRSRVAHLANAPDRVAPLAIERVAPWRRGGFVAVDEPLAGVVATLARHFNAVIELADPALGSRRITLYYPDAELDRVLGDLATMQSLTVERRRDGYLLRQP